MRAGEYRVSSAAKGKFCAAKHESLSPQDKLVHQGGFLLNHRLTGTDSIHYNLIHTKLISLIEENRI